MYVSDLIETLQRDFAYVKNFLIQAMSLRKLRLFLLKRLAGHFFCPVINPSGIKGGGGGVENDPHQGFSSVIFARGMISK